METTTKLLAERLLRLDEAWQLSDSDEAASANMSETLRRVQMLVALGQVRISDHGYDELANDGILAQEALAGLGTAVAVEDYAESDRGRSVLTLQEDAEGRPIHVVWGTAKSNDALAVLVTAYRPDPARWETGFKQRKKT